MNRGSLRRLMHESVSPVASMRPRFMNRGSVGGAVGSTSPPMASMRPRFMNRGSMLWMCRSSRRLTSFNEAPIHESGKFPRGARMVKATITLQ